MINEFEDQVKAAELSGSIGTSIHPESKSTPLSAVAPFNKMPPGTSAANDTWPEPIPIWSS